MLQTKFKNILSFDPGGTTGFSCIEVDYARERIHIRQIGEFREWADVFKLISVLNKDTDCIVYEDFILRLGGHGAKLKGPPMFHPELLIPCKVIGVIEYVATEQEKFFFRQQPSERIAVDRWYAKEMKDFPSHFGSATRHAIYFAVKNLVENRWPLYYDRMAIKAQRGF